MLVDEETVLERLRAQYEAEQASDEPTGVINAELVFDLLDWIRRLRARVIALEVQQNRAAVVDELPANAPLGALFRLRGDASGALYLGNGPTQPLTQILPTALA